MSWTPAISPFAWEHAHSGVQGARIGNVWFLAEQAAYGDAGRIVGVGDFRAQASRTLENLERTLAANGGDLGDVMMVTGFVVDSPERTTEEYVDAIAPAFGVPFPADAAPMFVKALSHPDMLLMLKVVAAARD